MTFLYKHLRIHQIFGANTDVGKTVITTVLCRMSALARRRVFYLKPVGTGPQEEADDGYVKRFSAQFRNLVQTQCLFRYSEPISPHFAARARFDERHNTDVIPSDKNFVNSIASYIDTCAQVTESAVLYLETAGGPNTPIMSGSTQADSYRPLLLPTILIGDPRLGGISSTISAYESLVLRGYSIDGVAMFRDLYYKNFEYLQRYFAERGISFASIPSPPEKLDNEAENYNSTERYYSELVSTHYGRELQHFEDGLETTHIQRLDDLDSMATRTLNTVWWPFVQHGTMDGKLDVTVIDSAWGDHFSVYQTSPKENMEGSSTSLLSLKYDGSASWWTQALGHGNCSLALAAANAAGRYGHVIFPQASHAPALRLAERLLQKGPGVGWASRVYFSDDGSTGMEIALKMALRAFARREGLEKTSGLELGVIGIKGSYHGDTIGAMDACEEGIFTCEWHSAKGYWFDPPTVGISAGSVAVTLPPGLCSSGTNSTYQFQSISAIYNVQDRLRSPLAVIYHHFISRSLSKLQQPGLMRLSALVLEPLIMGAGGMVFVDPLFQRILVDVVRNELNSHHIKSKEIDWQGVPVIFDEVFVGLYRTGMQSCMSVLGTNPDIAVYAKTLTGGLVPMAVTLASDSIFQAFRGEAKAEALLHGHSYTAHPVGCEVARHTLDVLDKITDSEDWKLARNKWQAHQGITLQPLVSSIWSFWDPAFVDTLSMNPRIKEVMTLGTVLAFKFHDDLEGYQSGSADSALTSMKNASISDGYFRNFGVHFRSLGNVAYLMCSLNTRAPTLRSLEQAILQNLVQELI